jgi:hypothetical protein
MHARLFVAVFAAHALAFAQEPNIYLNHIGRLLTSDDAPVEGAVHLKFALYENESKQSGETVFWSEEYDASATKGVYSLTLGDTEGDKDALHPSHFPFSEQRWLGITIGDSTAEMQPRLRVSLVPLAGRAQIAEGVDCNGCIDINHVDVDSLATEFAKAGSYANLTATGAQTGSINITGGVTSGSVSTGAVNATSLTATGALSAASLTTTGNVTAAQFNGSGAGLTGVPAAAITGVISADKLDLSGIVEPATISCGPGKFISAVDDFGVFTCTDVFAGGAADGDGDGIIDAFDKDANGNGILDTLEAAVNASGLPAINVRDGSLSGGVDRSYQYAPLSGGAIHAHWDGISGVADFVVWAGTTANGNNYSVTAPRPLGIGNYASFNSPTLKGAWDNVTYYVTVVARDANGAPMARGTSNGVQIAEAATWDGSTTGLRRDDKAGFTGDWPPGTGWTQIWGAHYFETVNIPSSATVRVQPFGREEGVPAGVSATDPRVTNPKDGWLGIYANSIDIAGAIEAVGRGYGGGGGASNACSTVGNGFGGSGGLSGAGGSGYSGAGGRGGAGGGGGGAASRGGDGLFAGGGGAGGNCSDYNDGRPGRIDGRGGDGSVCGQGTGYATAGAGGSNPDASGGNGHTSGAAGGGAGYGAGGGGGGWGCGSGGGGGGTGGGNGTATTGGAGAGPFGGASVSGNTGGNRGGYAAAGTNGDTSNDRSWRLGSGGSAGGASCAHGGGGGGAGGGAILVVADSVAIRGTAKLKADGAPGGGGATGDCNQQGSGAGGAGGAILLEGRSSLILESGALLRSLGGANGGPYVGAGGSVNSSNPNGGTVKLLYKATGGTYTNSATISASRNAPLPQ